MSLYQGLTTNMMAGRVYNRPDNFLYRRDYIYDILKMYIEEVQKALLRGERVQIPGVGTLIPEIKTCEKFTMPCCNKEDGNLPYTDIRLKRNQQFRAKMKQSLLENIENGFYGLDKLSLTETQMNYLKDKGFIPEDAELTLTDDEEEC